MTGCLVGGFVKRTLIRKDGCHSSIGHRWPDEIGRRVGADGEANQNPESFGCSSYEYSVLNATWRLWQLPCLMGKSGNSFIGLLLPLKLSLIVEPLILLLSITSRIRCFHPPAST
jgi:hypothetical protein